MRIFSPRRTNCARRRTTSHMAPVRLLLGSLVFSTPSSFLPFWLIHRPLFFIVFIYLFIYFFVCGFFFFFSFFLFFDSSFLSHVQSGRGGKSLFLCAHSSSALTQTYPDLPAIAAMPQPQHQSSLFFPLDYETTAFASCKPG